MNDFISISCIAALGLIIIYIFFEKIDQYIGRRDYMKNHRRH